MSQVCVVSAVIQASFVELTPLCFSRAFFWLIFTARYVLSSLKISYGEIKFEIFREQVGHLHFVLLRGARMFDLLVQVMLLLISRVSYLSLSSQSGCSFPCRKLQDCHRETFLCFFYQYHQAF